MSHQSSCILNIIVNMYKAVYIIIMIVMFLVFISGGRI